VRHLFGQRARCAAFFPHSDGVDGTPIFRTLTDVYHEFSKEMRFSHVTLFVTPVGIRVMAGTQALLRTQVAGN
jgi:hypothetical protein